MDDFLFLGCCYLSGIDSQSYTVLFSKMTEDGLFLGGGGVLPKRPNASVLNLIRPGAIISRKSLILGSAVDRSAFVFLALGIKKYLLFCRRRFYTFEA